MGTPGMRGESSRQRSWLSRLDERLGMTFWAVVLSVFASVAGAVIATAIHVDQTQVELGLIGAFLGSSPLILMPLGARIAFGPESAFAKRERRQFRALTVLWGALVICSYLLDWWPHHAGHASSAIAIGGLFAAILASWFWHYLPRAARFWARQQLPFGQTR
jgi:drug/metabolite transporter (DMT)-like permease